MEKFNLLQIVRISFIFLVSTAFVQAGELAGVQLASTYQHNHKSSLKRVTQGLRQKKVVLANFDVYVLQIFSNANIDFKTLQAIEDDKGITPAVNQLKDALERESPIDITMTFVRDLSSGKIVEGFEDVLNENGITRKDAGVDQFLKSLTDLKELKDKQALSFAFQKVGEKEQIRLETNGKEVFSIQDAPKGTISKFLNIWLGKPVSGLENLQAQLLKPEETV